MKKSPIILILFLTLINAALIAQVRDEFGTVKPEQLSMTSYAHDDKAEAVVLYDFGKTFFYDSDNGFQIIFERTTKIKIFSKAGLKYATVEIPYYIETTQLEKVFDIEGYTFNFGATGLQKTGLSNKSVYDEKVNDHWMVKKFEMPDVKEGSVIEYKYKVISPYFTNLRDWEFQRGIPTVYSEYTVGMIPFYEYCYIFQGAKKFDVFTVAPTVMKRNYAGMEFADNNYTFGMKNIPAFRDESFITSINDYLMKIDFQLAVVHHPNGANVDYITTWPLLNEKLLKDADFGLFMKAVSRNAGDILSTMNLDSKSPQEKAEAITDYVKANFNWDGASSKFTGQTAKDFLKTKTGNCASINLFLIAVLNAAGVQTYPVILSTRGNGKVPVDFPFQQFLNYVVAMAMIDNKPVLLDATEPLSPFGMLPARCINEKGLIVNKDKIEWIPLIDQNISSETDSLHIVLTPAVDSATTDFHITATGHKALDYRSDYTDDHMDFEKDLFNEEVVMKSHVIARNEKECLKPFLLDYKAATSVETVGDKLLVTPFPGLVPGENPLKLNYRNYPVDMVYAETNLLHSVIDIPQGYKLAEVPKEINEDTPVTAITYKVETSGDKIIVNGSYTFKKAIYQPAEYYNLKGAFTQIVQTFNNKIILVKI
ncbi:MAG TPA: transglutaminase domain-containing protein [Bacteroidales bacterium]|nr:transglutaminase domain-containing protein [Bacteroidales bacterium]